MHGRISNYNTKNGSGAIINQNKKIFELRKNAWHDFKTTPSRGMLVEFRLDDKGKVTDCRSSKYQDVENNPYITMTDFWATEDDLALNDIEENKKDEIVNQKAQAIDLSKVHTIKEDKEIRECVLLFFIQQKMMIDKHTDFLESEESEEAVINYFLLKRFLNKAKSQLLFLDKRINEKDFEEIDQELVELENIHENFVKMTAEIPEEYYTEIYLKQQMEYYALQKKSKMEGERLFQLAHRIKSTESDINTFKKRLEIPGQKSEVIEDLKQKITQRERELPDYVKQHTQLGDALTRVNLLLEEFAKKSKDRFPIEYAETKKYLSDQITKIINHLAYKMNLLIWEKASESQSIAHNFYKQSIGGTFNCMTFLEYYLKQLDKTKLKDHDKELYELLLDYTRNKQKTFVIVSENPNTTNNIKLHILKKNVDFCVVRIPRPVEFLTWAKSNKFEVLLVDSSIKGIRAHELMLKILPLTKNRDVKLVMFSE